MTPLASFLCTASIITIIAGSPIGAAVIFFLALCAQAAPVFKLRSPLALRRAPVPPAPEIGGDVIPVTEHDGDVPAPDWRAAIREPGEALQEDADGPVGDTLPDSTRVAVT